MIVNEKDVIKLRGNVISYVGVSHAITKYLSLAVNLSFNTVPK